MHSRLGKLGQDTLFQEFKDAGVRTYSKCRSSHTMASPYPFAIYSDLYEHSDFIRGMVNAGLSGLLWTPEVRQCDSPEELIRRLQTVIFSPMALVNAWMIKNPPWLQYDAEKNNQGIFPENREELEGICRLRSPWRPGCFRFQETFAFAPFTSKPKRFSSIRHIVPKAVQPQKSGLSHDPVHAHHRLLSSLAWYVVMYLHE